MEQISTQKHSIFLQNKSVVVYQYGQSDKKVLLVHGWSGRGTQLVKIADALLKSGFLLSALMLLHMESHLEIRL
jgi:esterase/lipase